MKTGRVAKLFGIDPKTVTGWVDEFAEFFTENARKRGKLQRDYEEEDLIVLNTIRVEKRKRSEIEQIRAILNNGHRETQLPPQSAMITGEAAVTIYAQMKSLEVDLEKANQEIERLRQIAGREHERAGEQIQAERERADNRIKAERETTEARIEQLIVEKTEWRMRYEALKQALGVSDEE